MKQIKTAHIFGGGTVAHLANHLAMAAPAYGETARSLYRAISETWPEITPVLEMTKMTGHKGAWMETHQDVANRVQVLIDAPSVKVIFFSCAMVDWWDPESGGKYDS